MRNLIAKLLLLSLFSCKLNLPNHAAFSHKNIGGELGVNQSFELSNMPDGKLIVATKNKSTYATKGELIVQYNGKIETWGVPALTGFPNIHAVALNGGLISILNSSLALPTPVTFNIFIPSLLEGEQVAVGVSRKVLRQYKVFQLQSLPCQMRVELRCPGDLAVVLVYIGAEPYLYILNGEEREYPFIHNIEPCITSTNSIWIERLFFGELITIVNLSSKATKSVTVSVSKM